MANVADPGIVLEVGEFGPRPHRPPVAIPKSGVRRRSAPAFGTPKASADALYVCNAPLVGNNRVRINTLALSVRLPTMHNVQEYVEAGGLMSYGASYPDLFGRSADFVDKILRGAKPADLPVEQPTKFDLVVNLTTARALGLEIPPRLLFTADHVIE